MFPEQPAYSLLMGKSACCSDQTTLEDSLKERTCLRLSSGRAELMVTSSFHSQESRLGSFQ